MSRRKGPFPTHFLALQVGHHPRLQAAFADVQSAVCKSHPILNGALVDPATAHLTILAMALDGTDEDISRAVACLEAAAPVLAEQQLLRPVSFTLRGLSQFNNKVLFLEVLQDAGRQHLLQLAAALRSHFRANALATDEGRPFEPHLTIAKLSRLFETGPAWRAAKIKAIPPEAYEQLTDIDGGTVEVVEVQLCAMGQRAPGEYYEVHGVLSLSGCVAGGGGRVPAGLGLLVGSVGNGGVVEGPCIGARGVKEPGQSNGGSGEVQEGEAASAGRSNKQM